MPEMKHAEAWVVVDEDGSLSLEVEILQAVTGLLTPGTRRVVLMDAARYESLLATERLWKSDYGETKVNDA